MKIQYSSLKARVEASLHTPQRDMLRILHNVENYLSFHLLLLLLLLALLP